MRVYRVPSDSVNDLAVELLDDADQPIAVVSQFLHHLRARGYSPNTLSAYAYDLLHFTRFLSQEHLTYEEFTPAYSLAFLDYLSHIPSRRQAQRQMMDALLPGFRRPPLIEPLRRFRHFTNISSPRVTSKTTRI